MMRVRVVGSGFQGGPSLNTFYFKADVEDQGACDAACVRVRDGFLAGKEVYPDAVTHEITPLVDILDEANGELVGAITTPTLATVPGNANLFKAEAIATALLLRFNTTGTVDGQRVQGRAFLSPVAANHTDALGAPDNGIKTAALALGNTIIGAPAAGFTTLVVWSRPRPARAATDDLPAQAQRDGSMHVVTGVSTPAKFAVLRSRRD